MQAPANIPALITAINQMTFHFDDALTRLVADVRCGTAHAPVIPNNYDDNAARGRDDLGALLPLPARRFASR
jgi:hypothetical protein